MAIDGTRTSDEPPQPLGRFVGRAGETAEIAALLGTARLFTLTGTGAAARRGWPRRLPPGSGAPTAMACCG
jgi:hypothetical protein